jgi:hypothetical protein
MTRFTRFKAKLSNFRAQEFVPALRRLLKHVAPLAQQKKRRLQKSFAELDAVLVELRTVSQTSEAEFLTTATALMELDTRGCDFVKQGGHLVNVAIGRGGGGTQVFADAMQVIAHRWIFSMRATSRRRSYWNGSRPITSASPRLIRGGTIYRTPWRR